MSALRSKPTGKYSPAIPFPADGTGSGYVDMLSQAPELPLISACYNWNYIQQVLTVHLLCVGFVLSLLYLLSHLILIEVGAVPIPTAQIEKPRPREVK